MQASKQTGPLSTEELNHSLKCLVRLSQSESFCEKLEVLNENYNARVKRLDSLTPFLDKDGIIRVGGHLQNSSYNFEKRHPIVLDSMHKFTVLLFKTDHIRLLLVGPQLLLSNIRDRFWPLGGRNLARKVARQCVICFKCRPT